MPPATFELKFLVPSDSRKSVLDALSRHPSTLERATLTSLYLDTADRRLAELGMAWRLRREGRRWVQSLRESSGPGSSVTVHEALLPGPHPDLAAHAFTAAGERLAAVVGSAQRDGMDVVTRFEHQVRRTTRRVRSGRSMVEVAYDDGRLRAGEQVQRITRLELHLLSGPADGLFAVARRWQRQHGLIVDPRSVGEQGDRLADGLLHPPVRKAIGPRFRKSASAQEALSAVLGECLEQVLCNAIGLVAGNADQKVDHVHQLRVGIRRLRSALSSFKPWSMPPPAPLIDGLKQLFSVLGTSRDADVMDSGVVRALREAGAPELAGVAPTEPTDVVAVIGAHETQQLFLDWMAWWAAGQGGTSELPSARPQDTGKVSRLGVTSMASDAALATQDTESEPDLDGQGVSDVAIDAHPAVPDVFGDAAARRLRRWHGRIAAATLDFAILDETSIHDLRKRIKRQRYAVEFFAPVMRAGSVRQYLKVLARV